MSLPTFSEIRQPGQPPIKVFDTSTDISLLLLPRTALTIGDGYNIQKVANQSAQTGFDNAALNVFYEFFETDKHEAITSIRASQKVKIKYTLFDVQFLARICSFNLRERKEGKTLLLTY
jgi:hypothetical protein